MPKQTSEEQEAERVLSSETRVGRSDLPPEYDKPGEGTEHRSEAMRIRERERELRLDRLLEAQNWRCAYACAGNGDGRPLLPGEPFAYIDEHHGIVHLECMKSGTIPSVGNPWTINGVLRGKH